VVGLDATCSIRVNFGTDYFDEDAPFRFDLSNFINRHEGIVSSTLLAGPRSGQ